MKTKFFRISGESTVFSTQNNKFNVSKTNYLFKALALPQGDETEIKATYHITQPQHIKGLTVSISANRITQILVKPLKGCFIYDLDLKH